MMIDIGRALPTVGDATPWQVVLPCIKRKMVMLWEANPSAVLLCGSASTAACVSALHFPQDGLGCVKKPSPSQVAFNSGVLSWKQEENSML